MVENASKEYIAGVGEHLQRAASHHGWVILRGVADRGGGREGLRTDTDPVVEAASELLRVRWRQKDVDAKLTHLPLACS